MAWEVLICARATRGLKRPSLDARSDEHLPTPSLGSEEEL
jgi:hypothetical protein